jgi:hypothetical protein
MNEPISVIQRNGVDIDLQFGARVSETFANKRQVRPQAANQDCARRDERFDDINDILDGIHQCCSLWARTANPAAAKRLTTPILQGFAQC